MFVPSKTLVIRFSSVGDIVLSTPLLRVLRSKFPQSQIDYVTRKEFAELVKSNHHLNFTYELNSSDGFDGLRALKKKIRAKGYDFIIDIHNSLRSRYLRFGLGAAEIVTINKRVGKRWLLVHFKKNFYKEIVSVADRYIEPLKKFGIENDEKGLELHIPDNVLFDVSNKLAALKLHRFERTIGMCPAAKHATKRWPQERFAELGARFAHDHRAKLLLFGGAEDVGLCSAIAAFINSNAGSERATDLSGQLSLLETAAAMQYCDVIVTNDSGLMHIAAAMKKKLFAIFGSTVREFGFFPYGTENVVIERAGLYCRPCSHIGLERCPEGHFRCMNEISVEEVHARALELFSQN